MNAYLNTVVDYLHGLTLRERILVAGVICTLIYMLGDAFILSPKEQSYQSQVKELNRINQQQAEVDTAIIEISNKLTAEKQKVEQIKADLNQVKHDIELEEQKLEQALSNVVPPTQITTLLRSLLSEQAQGLRLVSIKNEPVKPINTDDSSTAKTLLYEHAATIELAGRYNDLHDYLSILEQSDWQLFWDKLDYSVSEYPESKIVLRVHTVSANDYWIGL